MYTFILSDEEIVVVQLHWGRRMFRSSCVKAFVLLLSTHNDISGSAYLGEAQTNCNGGIERLSVGEKVVPSGHCTNARLEEICGVMKNGTFEMVDTSKVVNDTFVFGLIVADQIKPANNGVR